MKLAAQLYVETLTDCFDNPGAPGCEQFVRIRSASEAALNRLAEKGIIEDAEMWVDMLEYTPGADEEQALGIEEAPTMVIFDADTETPLLKLTGRMSYRKIYRSVYGLGQLTPTSEPGVYTNQKGDPVIADELYDGEDKITTDLPFEATIQGCPRWLPNWLCGTNGWVVSLVILFLIAGLVFWYLRKK